MEVDYSDTDSENDRRAYGQYKSLDLNGGFDIDEDAAAYLRSVQKEARSLPDVVTRPQPSLAGADGLPVDRCADGDAAHAEAAPAGDEPMSPRSETDGPQEDLSGVSSEWVREFMRDFKAVRLKVASLEVENEARIGQETRKMAQEATSKQGEGGAEGASGDAAQKLPVTLSALLALGTVGACRRFEREAAEFLQNQTISGDEAYSLYGLMAALEHPLMADTEALMGELCRHCRQLRQLAVPKSAPWACLTVLQILSGAYFGQDRLLRLRFREHMVHV